MKRVPLLALFCAILSGCGGQSDPWIAERPKTVPVTGMVILDQKPVEGAIVSFLSESQQNGASARTRADGTFTLTTFVDDDGAVPGVYRVAISKAVVKTDQKAQGEDGGTVTGIEHIIPETYTRPDKSGLTAEVSPSSKNHFEFQLKQSAP